MTCVLVAVPPWLMPRTPESAPMPMEVVATTAPEALVARMELGTLEIVRLVVEAVVK